MGFQVSPGVEVKEIDLTNVIPAVSTSIGGYSGYFRWGPVNEINLVSSEKELAGIFGTPDAAHTQSFLTAASFLKYGSALKVVRASNGNMLNAVGGNLEVTTGGIQTIAFDSPPTDFTGLSAAPISLAITESGDNPIGNGALLAAAYTPYEANGFVAATAEFAIDSVTQTGTTLIDGTYSVAVVTDTGTEDITITAALGVLSISALSDTVLNGTPQTFLTGAITVVTGGATLTDETVTVSFSQINGAVDGDILTLSTQAGDGNGQDYTVAFEDDIGVQSPITLPAGFAAESEFGQTTAVEAVLDGIVRGTFEVTYQIAELTTAPPGDDYDVANVSVVIDNGAGPVTIASGLLTFDEEEEALLQPTLIENAEAFEELTGLRGLFFARYAGEIGNSITVTVIDAGNFVENGQTELKASDAFDAAPEANEFHILISEGLTVLEAWAGLSTVAGTKLADGTNNYFADVINARSNWIYVATADQIVTNGGTEYTFEGGADWDGVLNDSDVKAGLEFFRDVETVDVNLLFAMADTSDTLGIGKTVQEIAVDRKDCVAFVSPTIAASTQGTAQNRLDDVTAQIDNLVRDTDGSYAVYDSTALYVYNKYADTYSWIPASGHMAGLCAKTDDLAEPWFSPAGLNRGGLRGVTKLGFNPNKSQRDTLYKKGVNPIANFPGNGIVLFGDKTVQSKPSAFDRINVRRLFIVLEKAIATAAKYQLFELNDEFTRAMFRNMTEPFLRDVKGRRGITDFLVVCDETNNTGEVIDTNRFVADIYIKPARSINFITLNFIATRTGVDFSEIVGN